MTSMSTDCPRTFSTVVTTGMIRLPKAPDAPFLNFSLHPHQLVPILAVPSPSRRQTLLDQSLVNTLATLGVNVPENPPVVVNQPWPFLYPLAWTPVAPQGALWPVGSKVGLSLAHRPRTAGWCRGTDSRGSVSTYPVVSGTVPSSMNYNSLLVPNTLSCLVLSLGVCQQNVSKFP